jgi:hypothetical protein
MNDNWRGDGHIYSESMCLFFENMTVRIRQSFKNMTVRIRQNIKNMLVRIRQNFQKYDR